MKNIFLFTGSDRFRLTEEVKRWKEGFVQKHGDLNLTILDGVRAETQEIWQALVALPFLGEKRLVIIEGLPSGAKVTEAVQAKEEFLGENLEEIAESTIVVFASAEADGRRKFYKALSKVSEVKKFEVLEKDELEKWVMGEFVRRGKKVSGGLVRRLCEMVGGETGQLLQEVEKLCMYADERDLREEDLVAVVHPNPQESIFALTDALASKDAEKMLKYFRALVDAGEATVQIFYMLVRQVRLICMVKSALEEGVKEGLAAELKLHPFVVRGLVKQAGAFGWEQLKEMYDRLLKLDVQMKTSEIEQSVDDVREMEAAVEEFLLSLAE